MDSILIDYFSQYQLIVAWKSDDEWEFYEDLNGAHPVVGIPEYGEAMQLLIEDFISGPNDVAELGFVRLIKTKEDDPASFNARKRVPVVQAVQLEMMGKLWGVCARVVFFDKTPTVRIMDDADGKLLAVLYAGNPMYTGMDFRFFLPMMTQAALPGLNIVDVSGALKETLRQVGNTDDLFRVFQERLKT